MMLYLVLNLLVVSDIVLASSNTDVCLGYLNITEEKRSALYTAKANEASICDTNIDESRWYRVFALPPSRIHDQCVEELQCGTEQPVWIRGKHPTADNPGPKEVEVCSPLGDDCCGSWKSTIHVKYCRAVVKGDDDYYVYRLRRVPQCDMAYCAGNTIVCPTGKFFNPNLNRCTDPRPPIAEPTFQGPIIEPKRLQADKKQYDDFYFACDIKRQNQENDAQTKNAEQYEVVFTFDGVEAKDVAPKITDGNQLRVKLYSEKLKDNMGKTVGCKVRSYWKNEKKRQGDYMVAQGTYYVGIRYSINGPDGPFTSPRIEIDERSPPLTLHFQSTVPISCPEIKAKTQCKFSITMQDIPDKDGLAVSQCSMVFSALEDANKPRTQRIKARPTPGIHQRTSVLRFQPIDTNPAFFWHNYKLPDIPVFIKDSSKTGCCSSGGDPHITTFDGRYYHVYTAGDYLLAKSTSPRHFEVHVRHHNCWAVTCNCAVAVREGNNVLGVNACSGHPTPIKYLTDDTVPGATITQNGNSFTITMPSGAYVKMDYYGLSSSISLCLNSEDYDKVYGLCGTFNGNPRDDTVPKGTQTNDARDVPVTFSDSYRLNREDSFIEGHIRPIQCVEVDDVLPNICRCENKREVACDAPDAVAKAFATKFTKTCQTQVNPQRRKRRDADDEQEEDKETEQEEDDVIITEDDLPEQTFDLNQGRQVNMVWPTPSGLTETEARRRCRSKVESSPVFQACKDQINQQLENIVVSCVTDVQLTDDVDAAVSVVIEQFQTNCVQKLESSVVVDETKPSPPSPVEVLLKSVISNICPGQCNQNGICVNGTCSCNGGNVGEDCSVNSHNPPKLTSFRKSTKCDFRTSICTEAAIFATNFYRSDKLDCKVSNVDLPRQYFGKGSPVSSQELSCRLPKVYQHPNQSTSRPVDVEPKTFYHWKIEVTNDGNLFSNSLPLTVYDSKCQECSDDGKCFQKSDTCAIDGRCYDSGERSPVESCMICNSTASSTTWSPTSLCVFITTTSKPGVSTVTAPPKSFGDSACDFIKAVLKMFRIGY